MTASEPFDFKRRSLCLYLFKSAFRVDCKRLTQHRMRSFLAPGHKLASVQKRDLPGSFGMTCPAAASAETPEEKRADSLVSSHYLRCLRSTTSRTGRAGRQPMAGINLISEPADVKISNMMSSVLSGDLHINRAMPKK